MSSQSDSPDFLSGGVSTGSVPPPPSDIRSSDADSFIPPPMIEEDDNEGLPPPPPEDEASSSTTATTGHFRISSFHHQSSHSRGSFTFGSSNSSDNILSPKSFSNGGDDLVDDDDENKGGSLPNTDTSIMEIPKEKSFATCLTHNFDIVSRQVEMGVYAAKRIGSMLKKITTLQDEFAKGVMKVLAHEKTKMDRLSGDGMKKSGKVWQKVQDIIGLLAKTYEDDAKKVQNEVIQPLLDFYEANEEKRKIIMGDERKASGEMTKAREEVNKNLQKCMALLKDAKKAQAEEAIKDKGDKNKSMSMKGMFKTFQKALAKSATQIQSDAAKAAQVYNLSINHANKRREHYLKKDLPMVFSSMQVLEKERLEQAKQKLTKYALIEEKFAEERKKITEQLQKTITELDTEDDINSFIEDYVLEHGLPTKTLGYSYQLPCSPKDIEQGRLEGNPKSVFRSTLEHIMELQKDTHPSLDVPRVLITCIEAVKKYNGFQSEGIFRISISKTELESLHKQIDDGNYDIKITSPHAPAALLKEWLRLLAEPLIPVDLYNEAVLMIKDREYSPSEILRFFDKLSPISRRVLEHLSAMAKEISNEINSPTTKMTMENLAIVFAPSFLRSPSDDPLELLQNSKYEIKFTTALFKTIAPQTSIKY